MWGVDRYPSPQEVVTAPPEFFCYLFVTGSPKDVAGFTRYIDDGRWCSFGAVLGIGYRGGVHTPTPENLGSQK